MSDALSDVRSVAGDLLGWDHTPLEARDALAESEEIIELAAAYHRMDLVAVDAGIEDQRAALGERLREMMIERLGEAVEAGEFDPDEWGVEIPESGGLPEIARQELAEPHGILTEREAEVFALTEIGDLTHRETGDRLHITGSTVSSTAQSARRKIERAANTVAALGTPEELAERDER
jgi:DNA-binding CsgD family transcriptional regulator